jgi:ABC-2 type transport system ATP-binding protein
MLSEVQHVADRVGIIRNGQLVTVESVSELRSKAIRRIELDFDVPVDTEVFEAIAGVRDVTVEDHRAVLSYDGKMEDMLRTVMDRYELMDIRTQEADLEEIFLAYYRDGEVTA